jgi:hypothetical protein
MQIAASAAECALRRHDAGRHRDDVAVEARTPRIAMPGGCRAAPVGRLEEA